ncbi:MAG: SBBP repeat-containing protein, partial [Verrucomicrobia bacterium]|nr:SBBP repeat-containing protein [Verrucomicrobiota bacterium]
MRPMALSQLLVLAVLVLVELPLAAQIPQYQWVQQVGGSVSHSAKAIAIHPSGDIVTAGTIQGSATFGSTTLNSFGSSDVFAARYTSSGSNVWVKQFGGPGYEEARGIATDPSGNIYLTGSFAGAATFGPFTLSNAPSSVFAVKLTPVGEVSWARQSLGTPSAFAYGICADASGCCIAGFVTKA